MIVKTLVENTALDKRFRANHGLSFYIETNKHKILFDVGENENFLYNASLLNVHIDQIDVVVISHAHIDHGGALNLFLEKNDTALIYLQKEAFEKYYAISGGRQFDLSLDAALKSHPRIRLVDDFVRIDDELSIFGKITGRKLVTQLNASLFKKVNQQFVHDEFAHEQCLVVEFENKKILFGGCAHSGIVNILEKGENLYQSEFDFVFSGFHLFDPITKVSEQPELVTAIEQELRKRKTVFYTGHCTGETVFNALKENMRDKIWYASAGSEVTV
ncbi:MBL fold metallo-hydrolase [Desulfovibrio sp.]|uniref:MBL fold metallo-hydrolase n=1 Tax=Desulfovibrio sp. TaxID=885 RepID=UPI0025BEBF8C|nr:MBL fold metallo-hydrolase [Desulfovibrio sp.]